MPDRIAAKISRKARWWMATAFVLGTALLLILGVGLTLDQRNEIAALKAAAVAEEAAKKTSENTSAVVSCLSGVYNIPDFLAALNGLDIVLTNQILAAETAIAIDPDDPLTANRRATLRRAMRAQAGLARLISGEDGQGGIVRQRRSLKQCRALASKLGVEFDPLVRQAQGRAAS